MAEQSDRPRRAQSQTERDESGGLAKIARLNTPHGGVPVNEFSDSPSTDVQPGETRAEARRRTKTPSERQDRVEERVDALERDMVELKAETKGQTKLLESIDKTVDRIEKRNDVVFESKVTVHQAQEVAKVDDQVDAAKNRRERKTKLIGGGVVLVSAIAEILRQAGVL